MKHFTYQSLSNPAHSWGLGSRPKPFAGDWPTRLFIRHRLGNLRYCGKPNPLLVARFQKLVTRYGLRDDRPDDMLAEFDRGGAVCYAHAGQPVHSGMLFQFYHHWQQPGEYGEHLLTPTHPKRIGAWQVYSPWQNLAQEYRDEFQDWAEKFLRGQLKPPAEKAPAKKKLAFGVEGVAPRAGEYRTFRSPFVIDERLTATNLAPSARLTGPQAQPGESYGAFSLRRAAWRRQKLAEQIAVRKWEEQPIAEPEP
jgi:hypothetical protein